MAVVSREVGRGGGSDAATDRRSPASPLPLLPRAVRSVGLAAVCRLGEAERTDSAAYRDTHSRNVNYFSDCVRLG